MKTYILKISSKFWLNKQYKKQKKLESEILLKFWRIEQKQEINSLGFKMIVGKL